MLFTYGDTTIFEIKSEKCFGHSPLTAIVLIIEMGPRALKGKAARLQAVEEMKAQKEKAAVAGSALAAFELEEDEDVYDTMDEAAYADVVEKRRNQGDFVVDDGKFV